MKNWSNKFIKPLCVNKGETLVESIVSLLILTIVMLVVATMLRASHQFTSMATAQAEEMQQQANEIILNEVVGEKYTVTFTVLGTSPNLEYEHEAEVVNAGIIAIEPE